MPALRIIDEALWRRVQERKATYAPLRTEHGKLAGKAETSAVARFDLNGILRCPECSGSMSKIHGGAAYYCTAAHRGVCTFKRGIPLEALNAAVKARLLRMLNEDAEATQAILDERHAKWAAEDGARQAQRDNAAQEVTKLEAEILNLTNMAARGMAVDIAAFNERRSRVEALKIEAADQPTWKKLDARGFAHIRDLMMPLAEGGPQQVRQVLRKLGVSRIMVTSDGAGWRFEGDVDFSSLLGTPEAQPPPSHPPNPVAPAKPALEHRRVAEAAPGSARGFDQLAQRTDDPVGADSAFRREAVASPIDPHAVQSQPLGSVHVELEVIARHPRLLGRRAERPEGVTIDDRRTS